MELALNLVWVCVAIAGVLALVATLAPADAALERSASYTRKIIAMGCALVILFFVISMTDDLHGQEVLVEERKVSLVAHGTQAIAHPDSPRFIPVDFLLFFPPSSFSPSLTSARRGLDSSEFLFAAAFEQETLCSRAPPSLS